MGGVRRGRAGRGSAWLRLRERLAVARGGGGGAARAVGLGRRRRRGGDMERVRRRRGAAGLSRWVGAAADWARASRKKLGCPARQPIKTMQK